MQEMWEVPRFSLRERDRRWTAVRQAMRSSGLDCLIIWGDSGFFDKHIATVRYLTQIGVSGDAAFVVFPLEGEPTCFLWGVATIEPWQRSQNWVKDVRSHFPSWAVSVTGRLKELGFERGNIGIAGMSGYSDADGWLSHEMYNRIIELLPHASFVNVTSMVEEIRTIKSDEEIEFITKAGQLSDLALKTLAETARPGVKECEVYGKMVGTMLSHGGEHNAMILWGAGAEPLPHPHWLATTRTLRQGDIVKVELHGKYAGYLSHQERTLSLGAPQKEYLEMYRVAMQCYTNAMKKLTPGTTLGELDEAMRAPIEDAGFSYWEVGIHGHGLTSREHPTLVRLARTAARGGDFQSVEAPTSVVLKAGMVVGVIADIINPNWKAGRVGVNFGDTVLISETGPRRLTNYDTAFIVI